jgi:hypothetical protein
MLSEHKQWLCLVYLLLITAGRRLSAKVLPTRGCPQGSPPTPETPHRAFDLASKRHSGVVRAFGSIQNTKYQWACAAGNKYIQYILSSYVNLVSGAVYNTERNRRILEMYRLLQFGYLTR